jgi:hypothetical protein
MYFFLIIIVSCRLPHTHAPRCEATTILKYGWAPGLLKKNTDGAIIYAKYSMSAKPPHKQWFPRLSRLARHLSWNHDAEFGPGVSRCIYSNFIFLERIKLILNLFSCTQKLFLQFYKSQMSNFTFDGSDTVKTVQDKAIFPYMSVWVLHIRIWHWSAWFIQMNSVEW